MQNFEAISNVILNRRSTFTSMFSGEKVPDSVIEEMLEHGRWAPTHKLTQPWHYVVFTDSGIVQLSEHIVETYRKVATEQGVFSEERAEKLRKAPLACSHVIAIGMKRHETVPEFEEIAAVSASVQNMWLIATARGVGCYWSTGGVDLYPHLRSFMGLGESDSLLGYLFCGMPNNAPRGSARRNPLEQHVEWRR